MKINTSNFAKIFFFITILMISCKEKQTSKEQSPKEESLQKVEPKKITLEKLNDSPPYSDAVLQLKEPSSTLTIKEGAINFNFEVNNYNLGAQTGGPNPNKLANSGKGQHIHFILNNQPYSAHYESNFIKEIPNGVHHLVAFLSRSYHESVKNENSVVVKKLEVGDNPKDTLRLNMEAPTLIYSRPKGTYSGKDTKNVLLDFFVLNTALSENGTKVRATINSEEFLITAWGPYIIKELPMGEITIQLELVDANDNLIPGPFNSVKRIVTLTE